MRPLEPVPVGQGAAQDREEVDQPPEHGAVEEGGQGRAHAQALLEVDHHEGGHRVVGGPLEQLDRVGRPESRGKWRLRGFCLVHRFTPPLAGSFYLFFVPIKVKKTIFGRLELDFFQTRCENNIGGTNGKEGDGGDHLFDRIAGVSAFGRKADGDDGESVASSNPIDLRSESDTGMGNFFWIY